MTNQYPYCTHQKDNFKTKNTWDFINLGYFFEKFQILSNILQKSNVRIIESSDSWSLNFALNSRTSQWTFKGNIGFNSGSSNCLFSSKPWSGKFSLNSWPSDCIFSCNSISFNFSCDSGSPKSSFCLESSRGQFSCKSWSP